MRQYLTLIITGMIYIAILYVLVRPNSTGAAAIDDVLMTFADLVRGVSGETYSTSSGWSGY